MTVADLYDEDFYLWTQAQAEALRAEARRRGGGSNAIDWTNLAEEVGDMGARDVRECFSRVRTILEHLWKIQASLAEPPRRGWTETVLTQRGDLADALTPTIRKLMEEQLTAAHERAFAAASKAIQLHEADAVARLDPARRWSLAQILGEEDDPLG